MPILEFQLPTRSGHIAVTFREGHFGEFSKNQSPADCVATTCTMGQVNDFAAEVNLKIGGIAARREFEAQKVLCHKKKSKKKFRARSAAFTGMRLGKRSAGWAAKMKVPNCRCAGKNLHLCRFGVF